MLFSTFARRMVLSSGARRAFSSTRAVSTVFASCSNANSVGAAVLLMAAAAAAAPTMVTQNHCQVPCGIFDDPAMVSQMKQDATTIRKAMVQSAILHDAGGLQSLNQTVRWITTKEEHCDKIISTVGDYCLCQRVKKDSFSSIQEYYEALALHHAVMQAAMKAKQTVDPAACDALEHAIGDLAKMYTK